MPHSALPLCRGGPDQGCANCIVPLDPDLCHVVLIRPSIPWAGLAEVQMATEDISFFLPTPCPQMRCHSFSRDQSRPGRDSGCSRQRYSRQEGRASGLESWLCFCEAIFCTPLFIEHNICAWHDTLIPKDTMVSGNNRRCSHGGRQSVRRWTQITETDANGIISVVREWVSC